MKPSRHGLLVAAAAVLAHTSAAGGIIDDPLKNPPAKRPEDMRRPVLVRGLRKSFKQMRRWEKCAERRADPATDADRARIEAAQERRKRKAARNQRGFKDA